MWQIENAVKDVLALDIDSGFRCKGGACTCPFRGRGTTVIDGRRYEWETGDSFVVPLWRFHYHENKSDKEAILFFMTDKPVMDALGFYREESEQGK